MAQKKIKWQVIVPDDMKNSPQTHEVSAAEIVAKHFKSVVQFIDPLDDYKRKTPDMVMNGRVIEIKSPEGNSQKSTVRHQIDRASRQLVSEMIFDGRRTKLSDDFLRKEILRELQKRRRIKRVIFISKTEKVLEIIKEM
ncbi:hypothetical protein FWG95_02500 [Candidatus Saccharibacteria bacterium]|nr:hypothetical protein [Candidatus Saccharibacteria bacterium]